MVSLAYVNGNQGVELEDIKSMLDVSFMEATECFMEELEEAYKEYYESSKLIEAELFVMESVDDKKKETLQNNKKNFVEKLGQTIINIFNTFLATANKIINDLKGRISGDTRKLEYLCKKDPSVVDKIKGMAERGEITLKDAKDFKDLDKLYEDIMKSTEDPNTLKAKWKKGCEKLEQKKGTIFGVAAAATAISAIVTLGPNVMKANNDLKESARKNHEAFNRSYKNISSTWSAEHGKEEDKPDKAENFEDNGIMQARLFIYRDMLGKKAAAMKCNQTSTQKIVTAAAGVADKVINTVSPDAAKNFHASHQKDIELMDKAKEAKEKEKKR